jgi:subtilisin family serine protease
MAVPWHFDDLSITGLQQRSLGEGIRVLLLDSGVSPVSDAFEALQRLTPDGKATFVGDQHGHGTACASVIASRDRDAPGIAPKTEIVAMRVTTGHVPIERDVREAFQTALRLGVHIISCSFTLARAEKDTLDAVRTAAECGILVVGSAGNSANLAADFPERTPNVLVVGAYDREHEQRAGRHGLFVDVLAPGEDLPVLLANGGQGTFGDTSGAAAVVSGVLALVLSIVGVQALPRLGLAMEGLVKGTALPGVGVRRLDPLRLLAAALAIAQGENERHGG